MEATEIRAPASRQVGGRQWDGERRRTVWWPSVPVQGEAEVCQGVAGSTVPPSSGAEQCFPFGQTLDKARSQGGFTTVCPVDALRKRYGV